MRSLQASARGRTAARTGPRGVCATAARGNRLARGPGGSPARGVPEFYKEARRGPPCTPCSPCSLLHFCRFLHTRARLSHPSPPSPLRPLTARTPHLGTSAPLHARSLRPTDLSGAPRALRTSQSRESSSLRVVRARERRRGEPSRARGFPLRTGPPSSRSLPHRAPHRAVPPHKKMSSAVATRFQRCVDARSQRPRRRATRIPPRTRPRSEPDGRTLGRKAGGSGSGVSPPPPLPPGVRSERGWTAARAGRRGCSRTGARRVPLSASSSSRGSPRPPFSHLRAALPPP